MIYFILILGSYFMMEFVAWFSHKYVMHGFLWKWHKDHHRMDGKSYSKEQGGGKRWEKNDLFFLIYALPSIILMIIGFSTGKLSLVFISIGIALYGLTYFLIHDIIIHHRLSAFIVQKKHNFFIKAVLRAHLAHHHPKSKQDFHNFGLLIFPFRYFKN